MTSLQKYSGLLFAAMLGCSSARLDPNTRAFTLYAPTAGSSTPQGIAGAHHASTAPRNPFAKTGTGSAAAGAEATEPTSTATTEPSKPTPMKCSSLPDPSPSRTDHWVNLALRFDRGKLELAKATPHSLRKPQTTKRVMGRFAAELWIGCELIDRVRFDFPLLAAEPAKAKPRDPSFEAAGQFDTVIMVPDSDRATRLELIDRATGAHRILDWPLRQGR